MKRTKYVAGIVAVSIMMMGAGYAAWTQNFNVTQSVNTGVLEFTTTVTADNHEQEYCSIAPVVNGNEATVTSTNLYPGAKQDYVITLANNSTIGTKIQLTSDSARPSTVTETFDVTFIKDGSPVEKSDLSWADMKKLINDHKFEPKENLVIEGHIITNDNAIENDTTSMTYSFNMTQFNK